MNCARKNCPCKIDQKGGFTLNGKVYCCETCAKSCTDQKCVCSTACDCAK